MNLKISHALLLGVIVNIIGGIISYFILSHFLGKGIGNAGNCSCK